MKPLGGAEIQIKFGVYDDFLLFILAASISAPATSSASSGVMSTEPERASQKPSCQRESATSAKA